MKKQNLLTLAFAICFAILHAQDFPGFRAGNYSGVNGVFFNPANIADSRYRFDFNLFSMSTFLGNNQASFGLKTIGESFNGDSLQNKLFGNNASPTSGIINLDVHGPSLMFNTGKKSSFALTTRARTIANVLDINGKLLKSISNDYKSDPQLPYTISSNQNMRLTVNAWTEIGVSYGTVLFDKGPHFFKGGITLKYLGGVANGYVSIDKFNGTLNEDILAQDYYLSNTTGRISTGFGGIQIDNIDLSNLSKLMSSGFGSDIGIVYEFRPAHENYKIDSTKWMRDRNKYKLKIGLALLDIGNIKYDKDMKRSGSYDINITGNKRMYLSQISDSSIDGYNKFFQARPQFFTPVSNNSITEYKVSLPSTLQIDVDYRIHKGFYASLAAQIPLQKEQSFNSHLYSSFTLTPRYEGKKFGIYMPLNQNELTNFNAGFSLRVGSVFFGSGSVLSAAFGNSKQADFHFGLHIAGLQKNKTKKKDKNSKEIE